MKKTILFSLLLSLISISMLTSCNEDKDTSADKRIASELPGIWNLTESQTDDGNAEVRSRKVTFIFSADRFELDLKRSTQSRLTGYSVTGTWNVKNEVLELRYNLNTLVTTGMSTSEIISLKTALNDNNLMLDDLKGNSQSYGMPIELSRSNSYTGIMKLSKSYDLAGTYTLGVSAPQQ